MAADSSPRSAGDDQTGHLRGRRCQVGQRQAGRVGGGRGLGVRSAHPPGAARGLVTLGGPRGAPPPPPPPGRARPARGGRPPPFAPPASPPTPPPPHPPPPHHSPPERGNSH